MSRIARDSRVRKGHEFRNVYKMGKAFGGGCLVLVVKNNNLNYLRYGLSVGKKIGGAVKRNRVKRLLREIMREIFKDIDGGFDLVFVGKEGIKDIGFGELKERVKELILKASNKGVLRLSLRAEPQEEALNK